MKFDVVLASASPRRRQLLADAGVEFSVHAVDVDEALEPDLLAMPDEAVKKLAERKAHAAVEQLLSDGYVGTMAVIGSDTMVVCAGEVFGKPVDERDAHRMLRSLSGRGHEVLTGVSVWLVDAPAEGDLSLAYRSFADVTRVFFRELSDGDIAAYIESGDPFDKAGAYGIQSGAAPFVERIEGTLDTVIGLPVERLMRDFGDILSSR